MPPALANVSAAIARCLPESIITHSPNSLLRTAVTFTLLLAAGLGLRRLAWRRCQAPGHDRSYWAGILLHVLARTSSTFLVIAAPACTLPMLGGDGDVRALLHRGLVIVLFWQYGSAPAPPLSKP